MARLLALVCLCVQLPLCVLAVHARDVPAAAKNSSHVSHPPAHPAGIKPKGNNSHHHKRAMAVPGRKGMKVAMELLDTSGYYEVQIQSVQGSCLAVYDGNQNSKPYNWACDSGDARRIWRWYPSVRMIQSQLGSCLAIYDGNNGSEPYNWACDVNDSRQRWSAPILGTWGQIVSDQGSCLVVYDGDNNRKPYGWQCAQDGRQYWTLRSL